MIQRIQSIFLFLASANSFSLFAFPFASTDKQASESLLFADSLYGVDDHLALMILFGLAGVLALAGIFLFKNRPLQLNICRVTFVANLIGLLLSVFLLWQDGILHTEQYVINDGIGAYMPIAAAVSVLLALRYIRKDEKLVRSMDRLR